MMGTPRTPLGAELRCDTCPWYVPTQNPRASGGTCHLNPPSNRDGWPSILPDEWCSEHPRSPKHRA